MIQSSSDFIEIRFFFPFASTINDLGYKGIFPVLELLEASQVPKPFKVEFTGKTPNRMRKKKIHSYLDPELLAILEPNGKIGTQISIEAHQDSDTFCNITFFQMTPAAQMVLWISKKMVDKMTILKLKKMFLDLVSLFPNAYFAHCTFASHYADFNHKYVERTGLFRTNFLRFLVWLQYLGQRELVIQGSMPTFEANPLLRTERIHNGLLVAVGESPYEVFTDDGEALLVKATFSLPPVQYPK